MDDTEDLVRTPVGTVPNSSTAIEFRGVTKTFRSPSGEEVRAADRIDLTVRPGELVALLGPNGAGKTTTLDLALGLTRPTAGQVTVLGLPPREAVRAGRVSAVLQTGGLLGDLTVQETVTMIASTYRDRRPVGEVLERAGLTDLAGRRVSKCSGGEQQRLRFALALLPDPDLLVLDEPTAGMDVAGRRLFWDVMRADADAGRTVVFATHYLEEANAFARRIVLLAGGGVVTDGTAAEVRSRTTGRTVTAHVPASSVDRAVASMRDLVGVAGVFADATRLTVHTNDSDRAALMLLNEFGARDLEIASGSLEAAFLALTGDRERKPDAAHSPAGDHQMGELR